MLLYSIGEIQPMIILYPTLNTDPVAVAAGALLPRLTRRDTRLLAHEGDEDEDAEMTRLRAQVLQWRANAARQGRPLQLPYMPFFLRNIWTAALIWFTILTFSTFFITKVWQVREETSILESSSTDRGMFQQATIMVSLVGICWAVACWVPFAIIMEVRTSPFKGKSFKHFSFSSSKSGRPIAWWTEKPRRVNGQEDHLIAARALPPPGRLETSTLTNVPP